MPNDGRIRFDRKALEKHADDYCDRELKLARDLVYSLRIAASCAPVEFASRVRRILNDADRLQSYFSKIGIALIESGQLVEETSRMVLEHLEDAEAAMRDLLN